jgi:transcriptional regulator with XRE-family HTH domain
MLEFDGQKLKKLRKAKKMTQTAVAEQVGKKTSHISNYENGFACPPSDVLLSLLEFFKVSHIEVSKTPEVN